MARKTIAGVALISVGMLAAACGGGSSKEATTGTVNQDIKNDVQAALGSSSTTGAVNTTTSAPARKPTSIEEWETLWASERAAIVKKIKDNK